ncbi:hypothetical protein OAJ93_04280 [Gammaproteobacteria bacterium]|nr:hypothetical protein [Gammaproteobacteria bacterium]
MAIFDYLRETILGLGKQLKWSYLPPLMVYVAAGVAGFTGIVGTFFIKEYLDLSAALLAGLGFWAGLPWALKMPLGHIVDLVWKHKNYLVYCGASIITSSLLIMYGLIAHTSTMANFLSVETWFVLSVILTPVGYVIQDVVADAMTVEAVPLEDKNGQKFSPKVIKEMHMTMQTLGRFAIIGGTVFVGLINVILFQGVETLSEKEKIQLYASIYLWALIIPLISVLGVFLANNQRHKSNLVKNNRRLSDNNLEERPEVNWTILLGSLIFVLFSLGVGLFNFQFSKEIVFFGSVIIILFLMGKLVKELPESQRLMIVGTAIIIFVFRAVPNPGPGLSWFEIDELGFNEQFFSILSLLSSILTLLGIILLRPYIVKNSIARVIVVLSIAGSILFLPSIGMYYGFHNWTASITTGIVDAKFIAIINTALESPLGQVAMIPLLAWIAKNAPSNMKATFFAVFASFTNIALSASALLTQYLNEIFIVTREIKNKVTSEIISTADYSELGLLLIAVTIITLVLPIGAIYLIQRSRFQTTD